MLLESCRLKKWTHLQVFFKNFAEIVCCLPLYFWNLVITIFNNTSKLHSFFFRITSIYWWYLFYLKRSLPYTHLSTFVNQPLKKQFSCEFFENFITAIVIKTRACSRQWGHGCIFWGTFFGKKGILLASTP